jgi:RNA polymerase sigma-70 factor (ECF subfamily)
VPLPGNGIVEDAPHKIAFRFPAAFLVTVPRRAASNSPMRVGSSSAPAVSTPAVGGLLPFSNLTDLDVVAAVANGHREMFEVIVRRYNQLLYRTGMAYLRDHAHVEDAMQNTYLKAFLHLRGFSGSASFSTWITRIMINECLMILRARRSRPEASLEQLPADEFIAATAIREESGAPSAETAATDYADRADVKELLERAIATLPRKYRAVYVLREIQHLSTAEVASTLGVSTASVKVDLHRARERLKTELLKSAAGAELFAYPAQYCDPMTARVMTAIMATQL